MKEIFSEHVIPHNSILYDIISMISNKLFNKCNAGRAMKKNKTWGVPPWSILATTTRGRGGSGGGGLKCKNISISDYLVRKIFSCPEKYR